jgi:hypothetical protein
MPPPAPSKESRPSDRGNTLKQQLRNRRAEPEQGAARMPELPPQCFTFISYFHLQILSGIGKRVFMSIY